MRTPQYRAMAHEMHLFYQGFPDEMLDRAHEKLNFEKERMQHMQCSDHIDTFEKFLDFSDVDNNSEQDKNKTPQKIGGSYSNFMYEGGSPVSMKQTCLGNQTQHCDGCNGIIEEMDDVNFRYDKDQRWLCTRCKQDYWCGLLGQTPNADKKRVRKLLEKMGQKVGSHKNHNKKQGLAQKEQMARLSSVVSVRQSQCLKCEKQTDLEQDQDVIECCVCKGRYHDSCQEQPINLQLIKNKQIFNNWECPDCKKCQFCLKSTNQSKMIICEMCDQSLHIKCLEPPLDKIPEQSWYCPGCIECFQCKKALEPLKQFKQAKWSMQPQQSQENDPELYRICEKCHNVANDEQIKSEQK